MAGFNPALHPSADVAEHRYIHVIGSTVFIDDRAAESNWTTHFLGMHGDVACWGVDVPHGDDPSYGAAIDLYSLYGRASEVEWMIAGRAVQLVDWARTHRFCGRCATPTELQSHERSMKCPACGLLAFPRLAPAMITLVTRGDDESVELADELAAEHLSIDTRDPEATLAKIRHAGAAFLGPYSPVAAGDYAAGPSHVLPTGGTARFAAGLSANEFLRGGSVIRLAEADLSDLAADIATLADTEGLTAHRRSVEARFGMG